MSAEYELRNAEMINQHLAAMMRADLELYERVLDTAGFAYHFNQLLLLARRSNMPKPNRENLTWTDQQPAERGYYWYLHPTFTSGIIVRVFHETTQDLLDNKLKVRDEGRIYELSEYNGKWAGPIPEPEMGAVGHG
ncbi:MAG: hypothetical protein DMF64_19005 [Acidobacteria bacterium]|nr:MAG: hypothetical protein DMF64_19005 [Acidobacteriota bacterium]